jgi:hypothetical protein
VSIKDRCSLLHAMQGGLECTPCPAGCSAVLASFVSGCCLANRALWHRCAGGMINASSGCFGCQKVKAHQQASHARAHALAPEAVVALSSLLQLVGVWVPARCLACETAADPPMTVDCHARLCLRVWLSCRLGLCLAVKLWHTHGMGQCCAASTPEAAGPSEMYCCCGTLPVCVLVLQTAAFALLYNMGRCCAAGTSNPQD